MFFKHSNGSTRHVDPNKIEDLANLSIVDAKVGDNLSIVGVGDELADLDFTIDRRSMIESGQLKWTELSGMYRNRRVTLDVHNEDQVEVYGWFDGKQYTLDELGLSEDDLSEIDERQNPADNFPFENKDWMYRWSHELGIFRDTDITGSGCYAWSFQEQNGTRFLLIRKFEGQPFSAYVSQKVNPQDITVYRG